MICHDLSDELSELKTQRVKECLNEQWSDDMVVDDYKTIWELSALSSESSAPKFDAEKNWLELQSEISKLAPTDPKDGDILAEEEDFPSRVKEFFENEV